MEIMMFGITGVLILGIVVLRGRFWSLRDSVREVAEELEEKMSTDTNTLISISSGDPAIRRLAGEMNRQLGALRDERRRLQNGDAELKTAVTNISHDLRTPLTAISGYLDLLEQEELPEPAQQYLAVIRERTGAMKDLTEELFRYSVITSASEKFILETVDLKGMLEQSLIAYYGVLTEHGITPELHFPEKPVLRSLDAKAIRRVFSNILNNVVKYSDGDLSVALSENGTIIFSNSARELTAVQAEKLFDRFYTVTSARNSTGLGLSIAKTLTERMGGNISAEYEGGRLKVVLCFGERG